MAQTTVNTKLAFGVQGEFYDSSVKRVTPHILKAAAVIGGPAWVDANGKASATGGASGEKFVGIFVSPKEYTNYGAIGATGGETLALGTGDAAQVADIGHIIVKVGQAVNVGDPVYYSAASGWNKTTGATLAGARFVRVTAATANDMAVVELNG